MGNGVRQRLYTKYADGPVDEHALLSAARELLAASGPVTADLLASAQEQHGVDMATALFWLHCTEGPGRGDYRRLTGLSDAPLAEPLQSPRVPRLLIVPGFFWLEHPELGGDGAVIRQVAEAAGIEVTLIRTSSRAKLTDNVPIIVEHLTKAATNEQPIWLMSVSKGTAELRLALEQLKDNAHVQRNLQGWVNFSGIFTGTPLADKRTPFPWPRIWYKTVFTLYGVDFTLIDQMRTDNPAWSRPVPWQMDKPLIHVLGVPLASHVQPPLARRWLTLTREHGPSDGMTPFADILNWPGQLYPVWGADHMMRTPQLTPLAYRMTRLMAESRQPTQT